MNQRDVACDEKKRKKVLAGKEKGCTFAPAFPEGEGPEEAGGAEFFESLRPAQQPPRSPGGRERRRGRNREDKRDPEQRRKKKKVNSTTESLILAQDERWRQA